MMRSSPATLQTIPREIRLAIWSFVWERRGVPVERSIVGEQPSDDLLQDYEQYCSKGLLENLASAKGGKDAVIAADNEHSGPPRGLGLVKTVTTTPAEPPVTLFINRTFREETLAFYKLAFAGFGGESRVYFNFHLDHLQLGSGISLLVVASPSELSQLRSVSVTYSGPDTVDYSDTKSLISVITENQQCHQEIKELLAALCPKLKFLKLRKPWQSDSFPEDYHMYPHCEDTMNCRECYNNGVQSREISEANDSTYEDDEDDVNDDDNEEDDDNEDDDDDDGSSRVLHSYLRHIGQLTIESYGVSEAHIPQDDLELEHIQYAFQLQERSELVFIIFRVLGNQFIQQLDPFEF